MNNFEEINTLDEINGGGAIGAAAGCVFGFTYGVAIGAYAAGRYGGGVGTVLKWGWASAMTCGAIGAFLPEP